MTGGRLSQEGLKTVACVSMLIDHIGAILVLNCYYQAAPAERAAWLELYELLRVIGRLAFPIYCFLLVEGTFHTKNPTRYGLRLLLAALLAELPFDLAFSGAVDWQSQSVMVTLLLGFLLLEAMKKLPHLLLKLLAVLPFAAAADYLGTDYGAKGILVIALFAFTRELPHSLLWQFLGLWFIFSPGHLMLLNWLAGGGVEIQEMAILAVMPIALYSGRKATQSTALQWAFYLFYPVHLLILYLIGCI